MTALELGIPLTLIAESVFARCISAQKDARVAASSVLSGPAKIQFTGDKQAFLESLRQALLMAKMISYAQGYDLMTEAAKEFGWHLNYGGIALMWRGGCIIRSAFLDNIKVAYDYNPELSNLLFIRILRDDSKCTKRFASVLSQSISVGIPTPCLSAALNYFDSYRTARLPANLLQAQRDYFGAHTYERLDGPRGEFHHTNWTGRGGDTASTTYDV